MVINKVDRNEERVEESELEIMELFDELNANEVCIGTRVHTSNLYWLPFAVGIFMECDSLSPPVFPALLFRVPNDYNKRCYVSEIFRL